MKASKAKRKAQHREEWGKIPLVPAFHRNAEGMLAMWCPYCMTWHLHGEGDGHRAAHCTEPDSPYHTTGYILIDALLMIPDQKAKLKKKKRVHGV